MAKRSCNDDRQFRTSVSILLEVTIDVNPREMDELKWNATRKITGWFRSKWRLLNAVSRLGDLIAAVRGGKAIDRESDPSLPSTMGTYLDVAETRHAEALKIWKNASLPP